jgi:hypothetical protein
MERPGPAQRTPAVDAQQRSAQPERQSERGGAGEDIEVESEAPEENLAVLPEDGEVERFAQGY